MICIETMVVAANVRAIIKTDQAGGQSDRSQGMEAAHRFPLAKGEADIIRRQASTELEELA